MVLHLLVYLIHVCDQLGEALVFCACIIIINIHINLSIL